MVKIAAPGTSRQGNVSWWSFVLGASTAGCVMLVHWSHSLKRDIEAYARPSTTATALRQVRTSLEEWLHTMDREPLANCVFAEQAVPSGKWYSKIEPLPAPEFSLVSAWLKTEAATGLEPPKEIPPMFEKEFTQNGQYVISEWYSTEIYLGAKALTSKWTKELVNSKMEKASRKEPMKYEADGLKINDGVIKYNNYVNGKRGIVIGSEDPWVEGILLHHGASKLLTVEFGEIISEHPQIETMLPKLFTERFLNGEIEQFDFGVSFSSLEHDGLGRYGDVLNPIGDLQTMAKMLSVIKPGGFFFLGFPFKEKDEIAFNAHRHYGVIRLPKIMAGWKYVDIIDQPQKELYYPIVQHLLVLQNTNGCANGD